MSLFLSICSYARSQLCPAWPFVLGPPAPGAKDPYRESQMSNCVCDIRDGNGDIVGQGNGCKSILKSLLFGIKETWM